MVNILRTGFFSLTVLILISCAGVKEPILPPEIPESEVRITDLSFTGINLEKSIQVSNPNSTYLEITGYDSDLYLADTAFITESKEENLILGPHESTLLTISFRLEYQDLYQKNNYPDKQNEAECRVLTALKFNLPDREEQSVNIESERILPLIREPRYDFDSLYVNSLGMMGADIIVRMAVVNLNNFDIILEEFQGNLRVNNQNWSVLKIPDPLTLPAAGVSETLFRFRLEFLSMGRTVRDLLSGESELLYDFTGESQLAAERKFLEEEILPLALEGEIGLFKADDTNEGPHSSVKIEQSIEDNLLNIFGRYSR